MEKKVSFKIMLSLAVFLALVVGAVLTPHFIRVTPIIEPAHNSSHSPLYEPGDRPTTIFLKEVETESGKTVNVASTIRQSKIRENQMQQAVEAYLQGPRTGRVQVPVPDGMALNEFYFTPAGAAVVDLSVDQVKKEKTGFYDEALFVRGLIETLTGNFFEVKQVKILVEGQDASTLLGHYALGTSEASMPSSIAAGGLIH
jgi:spore germination protein GerM